MNVLRVFVLLGSLAALAFALFSCAHLSRVADGGSADLPSAAAPPPAKTRPSGPGVLIDKKTGKRYETAKP